MDKEIALTLFASVAAIERELESIPHGVAMTIKRHLSDISAVADEHFPGGYYGECFYCDTAIGHDDSVRIGDEACCQTCWEKKVAEIATCSHDHRPDTDEHGDAIVVCLKCGHYNDAQQITETA